MRLRPHVVAGALLVGTLTGGTALAANGGLSPNLTVEGAFQMVIVRQDPGVTWTFATSNLSAGADTVIHVQDDSDPQGGFIAGNDDYNGTLASQVTVAPISSSRWLRVVLRRFSQSNGAGTCAFTGTPSAGQGFSYSQVPLGGDVYAVGALAAGAHVTTAEVQGGASDTVMLVIDAVSPWKAVAFDDDDGVGAMSWAHLPAACSSGCDVVLANFSFSAAAAGTNLIWDEDADSTDTDGDGLGQSLENPSVLNTSPTSADSDQDGIDDGDELLGRHESASPNNTPVKFPAMGALPTRKDLFLEIDWQQCTDTPDPANHVCPDGLDSAQTGNPNDVSITESLVAQVEADYAPVRVHMDIGRVNTNPSTWTDWGAWGGASRGDYSNGTGDTTGNQTEGCEGLSPERANLFHGLVSFQNYVGHTWPPLPHPCSVVTNWFIDGSHQDYLTAARTISHEVGHSLGLWHGGRPFAMGFNYKPHYRSLMNYLYQWNATSFSHGDFPIPSINPTSMSESTGYGNSDSNVLNTVASVWCPGGSCVNLSTGAVDWNRDGVFSATNTEGEVPLFDFTQWRRSEFVDQLADPALSWVSVGGSVGDQLWIVGRSYSGKVLQYARISKTALNAGCGGVVSALDEGNQASDCAGFAGATTDVPGPKVLLWAPAVAEVSGAIMMVFQQTTGTLTAKKLTINSSTGQVSYGADVALPGGLTASWGITALSTGSGVVKVWAPSGSPMRLNQWTYQNSTNTWSGPVAQQWSDLTYIDPYISLAATRGYQDGSSTQQTYAAIASNPYGLTDFAKQDATTGRWSKIASWDLVGNQQPLTGGALALVYQKRPGQASNVVGRFYLSFNQSNCSGVYGNPPDCQPQLMMTEGNNTSGTSKRLKWINPYAFTDTGVYGLGLVDDVTRDGNLRSVSTHPWTDGSGNSHATMWFAPAADGIINAAIQDMDDYQYVTGALRAGLCLEGGSWPSPGCTLPLP